MGEMKGVKPGPYSDVYAFGKTCCYALFQTTEPRRRHWAEISEDLAEMLEKCIDENLEYRLPNFEPVLRVLEAPNPLQTKPKNEKQTRQKAEVERKPPDEEEADEELQEDEEALQQPSNEEDWLENHPRALECARWYRELLAKFYDDVPMKFGRTMITLYLGGRVLIAVHPRKDKTLVGMRLNDVFDETVKFLTKEGVAFVRKSNNKGIKFKVDLQQLKNHRGAHEWIVQRLAPQRDKHSEHFTRITDSYEEPEEEEAQPSNEKDWLENHPLALECARWYRDLLAKFYGDVPMKFGRTVITLYVGGRLRVGVEPRKDKTHVGMRLDDVFAETVDFLARERVAFVPDSNNKGTRFKVDLQQLKNHQSAHEWIAQRLAPQQRI